MQGIPTEQDDFLTRWRVYYGTEKMQMSLSPEKHLETLNYGFSPSLCMFSSDERKPSANKAWIKCIQVVNLSSIYGPGTYSKWFWFSTSRAGPEHLPFFWKSHRLWWWHLGLSTRFSAGPNPNFLLDASLVGYRQATRGTPNMGISIIPILQIRKLRHREV